MDVVNMYLIHLLHRTALERKKNEVYFFGIHMIVIIILFSLPLGIW